MNAEQITVAAYGEIAVGPTDATMPTNATAALPSGFVDLGYVTEDGVTFSATPTVEDIGAWQSATPVRRLVTTRELTVATSFQQWNDDSFVVAFGGGKWTATGTSPNVSYRYDPPADTEALAEHAVVITAKDGEKNYRWVIMRANVTEAVETNLIRTGAAVLPVTFSALAPEGEDVSWYFLSDDIGFAPPLGGGAGPLIEPMSTPAPVQAGAAKVAVEAK